MKRWTLAVAVLLCGSLSVAYGDYVIIVANLGLSKGKPDGGKPGMGPGAGAIGGPGIPGAGAKGFPPGGGAIGGPMPPGLGAAGGPPAGAIGGPMPPGFGAAGGPPGGARGVYGAMGAGANGMYGPPGEEGGFLPGGPGRGDSGGPEGTPLYVRAVVEADVKATDRANINGGYKGWVSTKWGRTWLTDSNPNFQAAVVRFDKISQIYDKKKRQLNLERDPSIDSVLALANWTLRRGLVDKFQEVMKKAEEVDPKNAAVVAFKQIDADIKKEVKGQDVSGEWKRKLLDNYEVKISDHYALLYGPKATPADVKSRLDRLENNYKVFYYWFALQGKTLPVPEQRLVAVLVPDKDEFERQQKIFDATHVARDGFYASRENLVVFSETRLDKPYQTLVAAALPYWERFDRDQMLKGTLPKGSQNWDDVSTAQTYALLEKALEEDSELASVSHDGTRQLLAVSGLIKPGVVVPEWIQFGVASFFETPRGAPWTSVGGAHWDYLPTYKQLDKEKKLDAPLDALKGVITDRYFREAAKPQKKPTGNDLGAGQGKDTGVKDGGKDEKDPEKMKEKALAAKMLEDPELKAHTLAWALTFYLAKNKHEGLLRYQKELARLPRDIDFDDEVLIACFARAFDLVGPANKVDEIKLSRLADDWHGFINHTTPEAEELIKELKKEREEAKTAKPPEGGRPGIPPGGPGGPGAP